MKSTGTRDLVAGGLLAALVYVAVASLSSSTGLLPARPLYDGLISLPPYRWVNPPPERVKNNQVPNAEQFKITVDKGVADPSSIATSDGQAIITFDNIPPTSSNSFTARITPFDPSKLAPVPKGGYFDGNAYTFEATYDVSKQPVQGPFTVILRYAVHARRMLNLQNGQWVRLPFSHFTQANQQLDVRADSLATNNIYVVAGTGKRPAEPNPYKGPLIEAGILVLAIVVFAASILLPKRRKGTGKA